MAKKGKIVLSLAVREKLMRGQHDDAVTLLMAEYKIEQRDAERFIAAYREELRERRHELEVLKMQHENQKEEEAERQKYVRYAAWGVGVLVLLALIWLVIEAMLK